MNKVSACTQQRHMVNQWMAVEDVFEGHVGSLLHHLCGRLLWAARVSECLWRTHHWHL